MTILLAVLRAYWRPLAVAAVLLIAAAGVGWWGHGRYEQGRADERAESKLAQLSQRLGTHHPDYQAAQADPGKVLLDVREQAQQRAVQGQMGLR